MNDTIIKSISTYSAMRDIIAKTDTMRGKISSITASYARPASGLNDFARVIKYNGDAISMMSTAPWLKNDLTTEFSTSVSAAMAYHESIYYPKFPKTSQWTLNFNSPVNDTLRELLWPPKELVSNYAENSCKLC